MTLTRLTLAAAAGGALGAAARAALTDLGPSTGFPWVTLAINVAGSAILAGLPAFAAVRRSHWLSVFLGTGVLGGFTTMSAAAAVPVAELSIDSAVVYVALTLGAALAAVALVQRLTDTSSRLEFEIDEGDE